MALVDDHALLRNGLASLIRELGYKVLFECGNGDELIKTLSSNADPDIILLDINMPKKDGYETALWLKSHKPLIKILALSMYDDEAAIIKMLKNGAGGYILKDTDPSELKRALESLTIKGYYYSEMVTGRLIHSINNIDDNIESKTKIILSNRETDFLKLAATEMTYKEIADVMHVSPRAVDGYREFLFEKLDVKSRVGLVLYAIKSGLVKL